MAFLQLSDTWPAAFGGISPSEMRLKALNASRRAYRGGGGGCSFCVGKLTATGGGGGSRCERDFLRERWWVLLCDQVGLWCELMKGGS